MATQSSIRYAIYTRQSKQGLADFSSCQAQFHTCQEYAKQSGDPSLYWTGQHFEDEGYSGSTLDRPGMRRLRKVIDLGALDRVYAVAFDRITRNMHNADENRGKPGENRGRKPGTAKTGDSHLFTGSFRHDRRIFSAGARRPKAAHG